MSAAANNAKCAEEREIVECVSDGEPMTQEAIAEWLLQELTHGNVWKYAERMRAERSEASESA